MDSILFKLAVSDGKLAVMWLRRLMVALGWVSVSLFEKSRGAVNAVENLKKTEMEGAERLVIRWKIRGTFRSLGAVRTSRNVPHLVILPSAATRKLSQPGLCDDNFSS